jgi:hypothetical protein
MFSCPNSPAFSNPINLINPIQKFPCLPSCIS